VSVPGGVPPHTDKSVVAAWIAAIGAIVAAVIGAALTVFFQGGGNNEPTGPPSVTVTASPGPTEVGPPVTISPTPSLPSQSPPEPSRPQRNAPRLVVSPSVVTRGGQSYTVSGTGFEPGSGIELRWFTSESISFPVADLVAVDSSGRLQYAAAIPGSGEFCGTRGVVAAFDGVNPRSIAQAPLSVAC
jgi:hypothetical protein